MKTFSKIVLIAIVVFGGILILRNRDAGDPTIALNDTINVASVEEGLEMISEEKNEDLSMMEENNSDEAVMEEEMEDAMEQKTMTTVTLKTNKGDVVLEMYDDLAPKTVENFVKLASEDFYDGVKFHRIIDGFMIQGGDPLSKNEADRPRWGTGGPGYTFEDEIHAENQNNLGTISMANAGPNTNGSQFFINVADNNFLDTKHTVFGKVTSGYEVVEAIAKSETAPGDQPLEDVVIEDVVVS